jgi:hypothetical protein
LIDTTGKNNNSKISKNDDGWLYGDACEIHTPQEITAGRYAVTSLFNIEASHIPPNFIANPKYPKGCNERDYRVDKQESGKVEKYAKDFVPSFLINDVNTPGDGAIIVDENGDCVGRQW